MFGLYTRIFDAHIFLCTDFFIHLNTHIFLYTVLFSFGFVYTHFLIHGIHIFCYTRMLYTYFIIHGFYTFCNGFYTRISIGFFHNGFYTWIVFYAHILYTHIFSNMDLCTDFFINTFYTNIFFIHGILHISFIHGFCTRLFYNILPNF